MSDQLTNPRSCRRRRKKESPREKDRVVAKSKPMMSLISKSEKRSSMLDSSVSYSPVNFGMQSQSSNRFGIRKPIARSVEDANENTASSS